MVHDRPQPWAYGGTQGSYVGQSLQYAEGEATRPGTRTQSIVAALVESLRGIKNTGNQEVKRVPSY